jgi:predicted metal-dependent enzyme (double-stranded beta helix superfamily)
MPADCAHVAECLGDEPAVGLHVYGANVLGVERSMWDPETMEEQVLDWRKYEPLAQKASAMASAP